MSTVEYRVHRFRVDPQASSNPDLYRNLCKAIESLYIRVTVMEEIIESLDGKCFLDRAFGGSICSLKDIKASLQRQSAPSIAPGCPAPGCQKDVDANGLLRHIRTSWNHSHQFHRHILDQRYCFQCGRQFLTARDLGRHEQTDHGELHASRIDVFSWSSGGIPCKYLLRTNTGVN